MVLPIRNWMVSRVQYCSKRPSEECQGCLFWFCFFSFSPFYFVLVKDLRNPCKHRYLHWDPLAEDVGWRAAGVAQPSLQGGSSPAEPHALVCIMGEVLSTLLLVSALFLSKNGHKAAQQYEDFFLIAFLE